MCKQASPCTRSIPRPIRQYDSAKGELAKSEAAAAIAHLTVKRYVPLVGTKYISQQEYDRAIADARQADAAVIAAKPQSKALASILLIPKSLRQLADVSANRL